MPKFILHIDCDNDAFSGPCLKGEVANILRDTANAMLDGKDFTTVQILHDTNGNSVGLARLLTDEG